MGGPCRPWKDLEPGRCTMPTPHLRHLTSRPQHLASRPRHLPASRWPWRLGPAAFGLTTAALAALSPRPPCCPPNRHYHAGHPASRYRPSPHPLGPHPGYCAAGLQQGDRRSWNVTTQAPGTTTITTAFSSVGYHHPAPGDRPDHYDRPPPQPRRAPHPAHDQWTDHDRR
jgi:hypothetical protein